MKKTFYNFVPLEDSRAINFTRCIFIPKGISIEPVFKQLALLIAQNTGFLLGFTQTNYTLSISLIGSGQKPYEPKHKGVKLFGGFFFFLFESFFVACFLISLFSFKLFSYGK